MQDLFSGASLVREPAVVVREELHEAALDVAFDSSMEVAFGVPEKKINLNYLNFLTYIILN